MPGVYGPTRAFPRAMPPPGRLDAHALGEYALPMIHLLPLVFALQDGTPKDEPPKADPKLSEALEQVSQATGKIATDPTEAVGSIASALWKLAMQYGPRTLGVVILLVASFILARWIRRFVLNTFTRLHVDLTLSKFFANIAKWVFLVFAFLACLGTFGVNITSFAAILGAAGLAVGLALQGNLGNLASGILLLIFRPFKIGDSVIVAGQAGVVDGIDLFTTNLDTPDRRRIIVPNGAIFGGVIENQSHHAIRRMTLSVPVATTAEVERTRETLLSAARRVASTEPGGVTDPPPAAVLTDLYPTVLWTVSLSVQTSKFGAMREALLREVKEAVASAGLAPPPPTTNIVVQSLPKS
jgi:small conductance mechanosensitive channel